jgi:hypothetical protein
MPVLNFIVVFEFVSIFCLDDCFLSKTDIFFNLDSSDLSLNLLAVRGSSADRGTLIHASYEHGLRRERDGRA